MKRIMIFAALAVSAGAAYADPVTVMTPKADATVAEKTAYVAKLESAVKEVCYEAAAPVVGVGFYSYLNCIKKTRAEVGKQDPTGLYASRDSSGATSVAAK